MTRTPGLILPSAYSSEEELTADLRRRDKEAGFMPFDPSSFLAHSAETLAHVSEKPWSSYSPSDYTIEQYHNACLIHNHSGAPTSKIQCKLPVRTPNGAVSRNGVHAAAAALAGARGGVIASPVKIASAKAALLKLYSQLDENPPDSLTHQQSNLAIEEFLEHVGVKGMKWGVRRSESRSSRKASASEPTHEDFARATGLHTRAKSHGTKVLSNKEMQDVITRMNLEQQYSKLTVGEGGGSKVVKVGRSFTGGVLKNVSQQVASEILKGHAMAFVVKKGLTAKK